MKRTLALLTAALLVFLLTAPALAAAEEPPETSAASYVLMDAASGRVLAGKNADEPRKIASTTKIMTALLALETLDLDREVEIDPAWTGIEGSSMYLEPGQRLTVRELLYGLMLASGNDAAVALACLSAGSEEAFAVRMNERAAALGCTNTHFENPNGLDGEDHHSSACDLARITREAIRSEAFVGIVSTVSASVGELTFTNHNRLLRECEGVFGVKTGYTEAAGRTLVSCCERGGVTLICVTLSDADDWADHAALYDWAYDTFVQDDLGSALTAELPVVGGSADSVRVVPAGSARILHAPGERVSVQLFLPPFVFASVEEGATAGCARITVGGEPAGETDLVFSAAVDRQPEAVPTFRQRIARLLGLERNIYTLS